MLTQLLPSSTVALGERLKVGLGTVASEMPGGTCQPAPAVPACGMIREPFQYCLPPFGLACELPVPMALYPVVLVRFESVGLSVASPWLVGPVSPRTPMSQ